MTRKNYMAATGSMQSYLEGSILEQMIQNWQGTGHSAMQVLMDANQQNIKIFNINSSNANLILSQLQLPTDVMSDINNALNAGYEVTTPQRVPEKSVGAKGAGYIITDTVTGAASYRISGGLDGGEGQGPCAKPEPQPQPIATAFKILLLTAILLLIIASSGGLLAPAFAQMASSMGLSFLAFSATAGTLCTPIEKNRDNTSPLNIKHNQCANSRSGNLFRDKDVCIEAPGIGKRKFDAFNGSVLWEVKTYNFDNQSAPGTFSRFMIPGDIKQAKQESAIAHACGYSYWYAVGDNRHIPEIEQLDPRFYPTVIDNYEIDPVNCLRPKTK